MSRRRRGIAAIAVEICIVTCTVAAGLALVAAGAAAADEPHSPDGSARAGAGPTALSPTRFSVRRDGANWWSLAPPEGKPFFSLGVCVLNPGTVQEKYDAAQPSYAAWRHYKSSGEWADATLRRLKSWNFTTVAGWGDYKALAASREHTLFLTPEIDLGASVGFPWLDMWDEKLLARMEELATARIDPLRDDPRVIGYFSDNELGWWNVTMWNMTLTQPSTSGQRQRLVKLVREHYHDDWNALLADFEPSGARSWEELERGGALAHRAGGGGVPVMRKFLTLVADRYYQIMRDAIRKHDPDAMYLGDRYQSFYYPEVARASAPYIDVASTNMNSHWNDGGFLRCYLKTLHELTGKPVLVTEFYMSAMENRSGDKNATSGFPVVATQAERAAGARNTLVALASLPYVVGADWFQYYDEPPHGRYDGEDYNFGLVDINDQPYEELTAVFAGFDASAYRRPGQAPRADVSAGVPRAPAEPQAEFADMTALKSWDRERGFVPPATPGALGDLYLCWAPEALYVGLLAVDVVEEASFRDGAVPVADRAAWSVAVGDGAPITATIGGGHEPIVSDAAVRVASLSGLDHDVRLVAMMRVPAEKLGKERLAAGDKIKLHSELVTHGRAYRWGWEGEFALGE